MTITQMTAFAAVCREGSVTKAAEKLFIAQPAVSRAIKDLSKQCSFRLFENVGGKLKPTEKALELLDDVNDILSRISELEKKMAGISGDGVMKIGFNISSDFEILLQAVREMERRYPEIKIYVYEDKTSSLERKLTLGELDLALIVDSVQNSQLSHQYLYEKEFCWVCSSDNPLAGEQQVPISRLTGEKLAVPDSGGNNSGSFEFLHMHSPVTFDTTLMTTNAGTTLNAVLSGGYISLLPMNVAREYIARGQLKMINTDAPSTRQISCIYFKGKQLTPAMKELIDLFIMFAKS